MKLKSTRRANPFTVGAVLDFKDQRGKFQNLLFFVPMSELAVVSENTKGEEGAYFVNMMKELSERIELMPTTGQQDTPNPTVYLHYFCGDSDWYITEKDIISPGNEQAFGFVILNGDTQCTELGYISIQELIGIRGMELDLHWTPKPLNEVKASKGIRR